MYKCYQSYDMKSVSIDILGVILNYCNISDIENMLKTIKQLNSRIN
jgi:hypothetical protein